MQPLVQLLLSGTLLSATSPPAWLWSPAETSPIANDLVIVPLLPPAKPPTRRNATPTVPTFPLAQEESIRPEFCPTRPPSVVERSKSPLPSPEPAAPVTLPTANEFWILP